MRRHASRRWGRTVGLEALESRQLFSTNPLMAHLSTHFGPGPAMVAPPAHVTFVPSPPGSGPAWQEPGLVIDLGAGNATISAGTVVVGPDGSQFLYASDTTLKQIDSGATPFMLNSYITGHFHLVEPDGTTFDFVAQHAHVSVGRVADPWFATMGADGNWHSAITDWHSPPIVVSADGRTLSFISPYGGVAITND